MTIESEMELPKLKPCQMIFKNKVLKRIGNNFEDGNCDKRSDFNAYVNKKTKYKLSD